MKNFFMITSYILAGIMLAFMIGFEPLADESEVYDDEQELLGKQYIIRFSHVVSENSPKGQAARKLAQLIHDETNGKVKVEVYPNGTLYNDQNEWEAITNGKVEMIAPATSKLTDDFPRWQVLDLPFAFPNYAAVEEAYTGPMKEMLFSDFEDENVVPITFWYNGFKHMSHANHPLLVPDDFEKSHFRIMPSEVIEEQFHALGASTSVLPFNKVYRNLEVQFVEGHENTISNIYTKKLYQNQKHLTFSQHGYLGYALLINRKFWEDIPAELQVKIERAIAMATDWNRRHSIETNDQHSRALRRESNVEVHFLSEEQQALWEEAFEPVYAKFSQTIGEELMRELEKIQEKYAR